MQAALYYFFGEYPDNQISVLVMAFASKVSQNCCLGSLDTLRERLKAYTAFLSVMWSLASLIDDSKQHVRCFSCDVM